MRLLATLTVLACALALPAHAQSKAAAEKVGRIDAVHASSGCIGSAGSPVCATETLLACFARAQPDLCARVGAETKGGEKGGSIEYIIDRVNVIRAEDITEELRDVEWFKAGYTLVELRRRTCAAACGDESWEDMQVYLRPHGAAWDVVAWRGELEQEGAPEEPENFKATGKPQ